MLACQRYYFLYSYNKPLGEEEYIIFSILIGKTSFDTKGEQSKTETNSIFKTKTILEKCNQTERE